MRESHALLQAAHVDGRLVLLGRSFGGMIATHYADLLPQDVIGVIVLDTPAPSAEFTEKNEPELRWDNPGNTEHLDVVHGFENRFAKHPPHFHVPLLLITPVPGGRHRQERKLLAANQPESQTGRALMRRGTHRGPCATKVAAFVENLDTNAK